MADKQLLAKQNADDAFFADNDPLAELARIVSFEPQAEVRAKPVSGARREPEFNLEDELLKEFEQYEAPAVIADVPFDLRADGREHVAAANQAMANASHRAEPQFSDAARFDAEPAFAEEVADHSDAIVPATEEIAEFSEIQQVVEPQRPQPELRAVEPVAEAPVEPARPVSHPVFDLEDEILREFAAFDARRVTAPAHEPVLAETVEMPAIEEAVAEHAPQVEIAEPVAENAFSLDNSASAGQFELRGYGDQDLIATPEVPSVDWNVSADDADEIGVDPGQWHDLKEPLLDSALEDELVASVAAATADYRDLDPADEIAHTEADFSAEQGWKDDSLLPGPEVDAARHDEPQAVYDDEVSVFDHAHAEDLIAAPAAVRPVDAVTPLGGLDGPALQEARADDFGADGLLDDIDHYPVSATPARWPVAADAGTRVEPSFAARSRQTPTLADATRTNSFSEAYEPLAAPAAATAKQPEPEAFDDGAFELDLTEIELDMLEMEVETAVAPAEKQDEISASNESMSALADASVEEKPAVATQASSEDYSSLPFDPTQVATEEDPVEALAEMDVPQIPVVAKEEPVAAQPEYDIDIDAEMAHLFTRPAEPASRPVAASRANISIQQAGPVAAAGVQQSFSDLDEFERALEEDFRRSLTENRATSSPDRVALTPAQIDDNGRGGATTRRLMVLAASVAGLVLIGGAGVYAFWGSGSKILSTSSEPKIILADKDPVKVVPEDRGGQTVPNQDKAVYDRVAGEDPDKAKQEKLVSNSEEPVDVVQKTLMPENLPLDDDPSAADTADSTDGRLLADDEQQQNVTKSEKVVNGVAPRKVRTMVVRSDGTLVPRDEDPASADDSADKSTQNNADAPATAKLAERSLDASTADVPERLATDESADNTAEQPVDTAVKADTKSFKPTADDTKPAEKQVVDQATAPVDNDEVASDVDANAVAKPATEVDPVKQAIESQPTETSTTDQAAITEAANADVEEAPVRPVKTTKITQDTPIPENRPVDQPVNVVGRVTDQGNVAKTDDQQVASAETTQTTDNAAATQTTSVAPGSYVIQIASLPSADEAQKSYNKLSQKFASVIGGRGVDIKRAEIKNKGTYYRVRIPAGTKQEAAELCSRYKSAGGSCLVSR